VVAPDRHLLDVVDVSAGLLGQLAQRAVVIQPGHGVELAAMRSGALLAAISELVLAGLPTTSTRTSRAAWSLIALPCGPKDGAVGGQQILALHAGAARPRADQHGEIGVFERDFQLSVATTPGQQRKGAVVQFHHHALQGLDSAGVISSSCRITG
jgi:hypothetical protein